MKAAPLTQEQKRLRQKRYRLHHIIRCQGYNLITRNRTIYVPAGQEEFTKHVLKLRDQFAYAIQPQII